MIVWIRRGTHQRGWRCARWQPIKRDDSDSAGGTTMQTPWCHVRPECARAERSELFPWLFYARCEQCACAGGTAYGGRCKRWGGAGRPWCYLRAGSDSACPRARSMRRVGRERHWVYCQEQGTGGAEYASGQPSFVAMADPALLLLQRPDLWRCVERSSNGVFHCGSWTSTTASGTGASRSASAAAVKRRRDALNDMEVRMNLHIREQRQQAVDSEVKIAKRERSRAQARAHARERGGLWRSPCDCLGEEDAHGRGWQCGAWELANATGTRPSLAQTHHTQQ